MRRPLIRASRYLGQGNALVTRVLARQIAIVAALAVAVYANAVGNGLHVDDRYELVTNPLIRSLGNLPAVFSSGVWDFDGRVSSYYRPMMYVWYTMVYAVAGTSAWAYHLLNVALHAGTAGLAFLVTRALLTDLDSRHPWWRSPALLAGMLFAVHPIHTEPVAWAAGVVDLSYSFFYLLAFYLVVRETGRGRDLLLALAAYAAALLSKEPAITLPALLLVYWWLRESRPSGVRELAMRLVPWIAVSAAYLGLRAAALGSLAPETSPVDLSPWEYVLTAVALLGRFLRAMVLPTELNFWHVFVPVKSFWSVEAAAAVATVGAWAVLAVWAVRRRTLVPALALGFAVVPLTPALMLASLNQGLENAFAERYLYLPSFGVVLLAGWAVAAIYPARVGAARTLTAILASVGVLGAAATVKRNPVWKDSLSLWADATAQSPQSGVANLNYGYALMAAGQSAEGRRYVDRGVALNRDLIRIEMDRAISYAQQQRAIEAILAFHRVLAMDPNSAEAHYNLGVLYEEQGQTARAIGEYLAAVKFNPKAADAHNNLGILYFTGGFRAQALEHLEEAVRLQPNDPAFNANLERAKGG